MTKKKLIIIDDDPVMEKIYQSMLSEIDVDYTYYSDSVKAFNSLKEDESVVCIVDLVMPDYTGADIAVRFSEVRLFEKGAIYLCTSQKFDNEELFKMLTLGFTDIIYKPFSQAKIYEILETHDLLKSTNSAI